ncbi:MAG TPA: ribonuclease P protein component [Clostridia bacterium]|nr:ribonuclease P protein component [Clostridia bacterium]HPQ47671.1 ribonuclease P protein component [Clostridia bacterium]HRX41766.1 ribonuclease P protein component [Clostridia bacterium]
MKKTESIKLNYEFARVYKKGSHYKAKNLTLYVLDTNRQKPRLGITVSRKAYGRSVDRNRVRRLVRESFRIFEEDLKRNTDMVFVIKKNRELPDFFEIKNETEYLLKLSGLI